MLQILVRTQKDNNALNQLIVDCILYNLNEKEALDYIESRFGKALSPRAYYLRKKMIDIHDESQKWIENFTKVGLLVTIHQLIDSAQKQYSDIMHQLYIEKNKEKHDDYKMMKLRHDLREQGLYIMKLSDTVPVMLQVRKLLSNQKD